MGDTGKRRIASAWRMLVAILLDPPGWVPAWALTGMILYLAHGAAAAAEPQRLESLRVLTDTYKVTLAIWLSYKGIGTLAAFLTNWLAAPKHQETTDKKEGPQA